MSRDFDPYNKIQILERRENKLVFSLEITECDNCGHPAIPRYQGMPRSWKKQLEELGVRVMTYATWNRFCSVCIDEGGFEVECDQCHDKREYPAEFAYQFVFYPRYPEEDPEYQYICKTCVDLRPGEVLKLSIQADDSNTAEEAEFRD